MTSAIYDNAIVHIGIGEINWSTDATDIYCMLTDNTAPTKTTHDHYDDVKAQPSPQLASGNGYTTGGNLVDTAEVTMSGAVAQFLTGSDTTWTSSSFTCYYAIVKHGTIVDDAGALLTYHDLTGPVQVISGTLTLDWNAAGVFTMTSSTAT